MTKREVVALTGGPAFPCDSPVEWWDGGEVKRTAIGLTIRDWFAGMALQGELANGYEAPDKAAKRAYEYADAMIAARKLNQE